MVNVWVCSGPQHISVLPKNCTQVLSWSCMRHRKKCGKTLQQGGWMPSCLIRCRPMRVFWPLMRVRDLHFWVVRLMMSSVRVLVPASPFERKTRRCAMR